MKLVFLVVLALLSFPTSAAREEVESTNPVEPKEARDPYEQYLRQEEEAEQREPCICPQVEAAPQDRVFIFAPESPAKPPEAKPDPLPTGYDDASYRPMWP